MSGVLWLCLCVCVDVWLSVLTLVVTCRVVVHLAVYCLFVKYAL